jgi:hypothetical protein
VGILAGIIFFGASGTEIFSPWGWGHGDGGKNSPAGTSGRGSGKKHSSPRIPQIRPLLNFLFIFLYFKILGIYFAMYYEIFWL